jgi:hypothetical protein
LKAGSPAWWRRSTPDVPIELGDILLEHMRQPQPDGGMPIVAAGVHHAGVAGGEMVAPERWLPAFEGGFAGVVATLDTGRPGPTLAFRVDMDALDLTSRPSASW